MKFKKTTENNGNQIPTGVDMNVPAYSAQTITTICSCLGDFGTKFFVNIVCMFLLFEDREEYPPK